MQAFLPAAPHHPSAAVSLAGLALAFFWRTSPDTRARTLALHNGQPPSKRANVNKRWQGRRGRRDSQLPGLAKAIQGRRTSEDETLASISVNAFCDQAEEELVARAAEVATEVRLLQNELRQVR